MRTASCACGQLKATCDGEPQLVAQCHCLDCQRRTGSNYGIAAFFPREAVKVEGDAKTFRRSSHSGHAVTFHFCPACGSSVFWEPERKPDAIAVAVGCFGDPDFPAPARVAWEERRHGWVAG
ncbi:aldehyde-activating protein [Mesorhizobium hawassense]|uniref:Aldehyde-activating protein n=1 Tax=Mesorhizobium hawassense TaxID=1209954 RepID=A0A330HHJ4_9HYPH|nr:GFA family protein [Mesorhizobium hawassense]RAZ86972.1 aldehyde-activating protein [Mesorhizobium hawassense]